MTFLDSIFDYENNPALFAEHFLQVNGFDGIKPFKPYKWQKEFLGTLQDNKRVILKHSRQVGCSTVALSYIAHKIVFAKKPTTIAIAAINGGAAESLRTKLLDLLFLGTRSELQVYPTCNNREMITFENDVNVLFVTPRKGTRARTVNLLYIDGMAYMEPVSLRDFWISVYPTLARTKSQVIISSTPHKMRNKIDYDLFYKLYSQAVYEHHSTFTPVTVSWDDVPRDESYYNDCKANLSLASFMSEIEGCFI